MGVTESRTRLRGHAGTHVYAPKSTSEIYSRVDHPVLILFQVRFCVSKTQERPYYVFNKWLKEHLVHANLCGENVPVYG